MKLADRLDAVAPSATLALAQKAHEMKASGRDVVSLTAGEPDFSPAPHIIAAIKQALDDGYTRYTAVGGLAPVKAGIRAYYEARGRTYPDAQIVVSTGAKQAVFNAALSVLNPGDEAVLLAPYWLSYGDIARIAGAEVVAVQTAEEDGFVVRPEALDAALTSRSRFLFLNSPNNPTGGVYAREDLEAVAEVLRRYPEVVIMADEIYERFVYGDAQFVSLLDVAPDLAPRTVVVNGCSKAYAMTGLRVGWAVGPAPLIKAMTKLQGQSTSNSSAPIQLGALAAISGDQSAVDDMVSAFDERRRFVVERLQALPGVTCFDPRGAFYAFPSVAGLIGGVLPDGQTVASGDDLCTYLLNQYAVVAVPGSPFGAPSHIRLSYATDLETLDRGLARIGEAFSRVVR